MFWTCHICHSNHVCRYQITSIQMFVFSICQKIPFRKYIFQVLFVHLNFHSKFSSSKFFFSFSSFMIKDFTICSKQQKKKLQISVGYFELQPINFFSQWSPEIREDLLWLLFGKDEKQQVGIACWIIEIISFFSLSIMPVGYFTFAIFSSYSFRFSDFIHAV